MNMKNLFNEDVMSIDTYIMVKLKEKTAQLSEKLCQKNVPYPYLWVLRQQILQKCLLIN